MDDKIIVINITSVAFSGSTWLNLLLGSHPEAFSVGEMIKLLSWEKPVCTIHGDDCPVWSGFRYFQSENPFVRLGEITGKRILVINNSRKLLPIQQDPRIEPRFIHLVRDGRAVTASMLRKYDDYNMFKAAKRWSHDVRRNRRLIERQPRGTSELVIYEKLKADTGGELNRMCESFDIRYEPGMEEFWNHEHHFIGGNRGTLYGMLRKSDSGAELAKHPRKGLNFDLTYYKQTDASNFTDERWKQELTNNQLRLFGLVAGRLNRSYGYPPSLRR